MANWFTNQKAKRLMMDMPIEHDMHRDGPKNMQNVLAGTDPAQAPAGGMPMYGEEKPGGPPMMSKGPKHANSQSSNKTKHHEGMGTAQLNNHLDTKGGAKMYGEEKPGGPPMHDGPKNYDTDKGSHAHPHDGPKKYDKVVLGGNKGDKSKTKKGKKDYGG